MVRQLLELYLVFFKLGIVNFGGGYAMLPLLERELVDKRGWTTSQEIADYYAIGQCTPGAIAVNVSTFIGYKIKGTIGGIAATLGFVSPAFIIIFIIASLLTNFSNNLYVADALVGIRCAVVALVLSAIIKLWNKSVKGIVAIVLAIIIAICAISIKVIPLYVYVILAGVFGIVYKKILEKRAESKLKVKENIDPSKLKNEEELQENKESIEEKPKKDKSFLWFILGAFLGLCIGFFGLLLSPIIKKKRYTIGVITTSFFFVILAICLSVSLIYSDYTLFRLYFEFFRVGISAFGGGLATIPFLKELGETTGWFDAQMLADMIAVSESTPGAMGVNMSTYVGYTVANITYNNYFVSFIGSIISTLGLVSPSIIVIEIVSLFLAKFKDNKYVQYAFYGLRIASIGLIIAAFYSILKVSVLGIDLPAFDSACQAFKNLTWSNFYKDIWQMLADFMNNLFIWRNTAIAVIFIMLVFKFKKHPVFYIAIAAIIGVLLQLGR